MESPTIDYTVPAAATPAPTSTLWVIFVVLLFAFIGFNIFAYLYYGSEFFLNAVKHVLGIGAKAGTATAANLAAVSPLPASSKSELVGSNLTFPTKSKSEPNELDNALDNHHEATPFKEDDASSSIQRGQKAGWCFIGAEKGYRTCAEVTDSDKCMSGDIFPSQTICMNPTLRK